MKNVKRALAMILSLCLLLSLLPPVQRTRAAEVTQRYVLDTDGIEVGGTYLIVNTGTAGSANALRFYYGSSWSRDLRNQTLTVEAADGVTYIDVGFTNEADCQFQFTGTGAGNITHGNYSVDLDEENFVSGDPSNTLTFTNLGGGQYRIHYTSWWRTYYLRYYNSDWERTTTSSSVYLYKLTDYVVGYDVNYNGNGYTEGTLPENKTELSAGEPYTVQAPSQLRKDVGEDTWLFLCWNTAPDGTGTEYAPGETFAVTGDVTLYAQWYQQTKYVVAMITYMNGVATDVDKFAGYDRQFYARLEGGDGTYLPLTRKADGTYSTKVVENGTYVIYAVTAEGEYEAVHGHTVVIYNQDGTTECMHYSVSYDVAGGSWAEGEAPAAEKHHYGEAVTAHDKLPTKAGYRFLGWSDQNGNRYAAGQLITSQISEQLILTALWEETITVTVNVVIDHNSDDGGQDRGEDRREAIFTLLRQENGVNLPISEKTLVSGYQEDKDAGITTYQVIFKDMPQGIYHAAATKSNYETAITYEGAANTDQVITIRLNYTPGNYDLVFEVEVNAENEAEAKLQPQAVNVKVSYWGPDEKGVLGWHIITQQAGSNAPTTVTLDENGKGTAFFPVWVSRTEDEQVHAYEYRLEVTSFILPDGTIVPATTTDQVTYRLNGSGLYQATVAVEAGGRVPTYPPSSDTDLPGAYFDGEDQNGALKVLVDITPMTLTLDAKEGTVNGQQTVTIENLYRYPSLLDYIAVPTAADQIFLGWEDAEGNLVTDPAGQLLAGNTVLYARYSKNITISGTVTAAATYQQNGQTVFIHSIDRVDTVLVVLQKQVGTVYNDIGSVKVDMTYPLAEGGDENAGRGVYAFTDLPNDGTVYRIQVLTLNYTSIYDNDQNADYSNKESVAVIDMLESSAQVDVHMDFTPDSYQQGVKVNVNQIHEDLRPTGALVQIIYRDLGDVHNYKVISQHTVAPYGVMVEIAPDNIQNAGFCDVWNWHTGGTPYEYQAQVSTVYGNNVTGAYEENGTAYTENSPFTIVYGPANNYLRQTAQNGVMLEATLVPKEYPIYLDLNLGENADTPVYGLEDYMVDDGSGNERYAFSHTWSFEEEFVAYPYREGYVFTGWKGIDPSGVYIDGIYEEDGIHVQGGAVHVGNTLARAVTLQATWEELKGTDYTIRHLELNTDQVLQGAMAVTGTAEGMAIVAANEAADIPGFVYAGAMVGGKYIDKTDNPVMTVTNDPLQNLMVIYYLPDGSDGYTEQVESNLTINKTAVLEDNGTYTITMDMFTRDNPITTLIQQNTPLDIVLVLDQSGSLAANDFAYLTELQTAVTSFVESVADHGRRNEVDHRIAFVGYAGNATDGHSSDPVKATGGKESDSWINTGVFDSNGEYHLYNVNGFNYTQLKDTSTMTADGIYYTKVTANGQDKYLLLTHHNEYRHLIDEEEARVATLRGEVVYGYVYDALGNGGFTELTRNSSGLWLYGNRQLYSDDRFFTYHTDVWTHRDGLAPRQIHAYGIGAAYTPTDGHEGVYTREETTGSSYQQSIYQDALVPVSLGAAGSGGTNPGLTKAIQAFGADGATRASYGMEMANKVMEATPVDESEGRVRLVVMFTDGEPGYLGFDSSSGDDYYQQAVTEANNAIAQAYISKNTHKAYVYTIGLYESAGVEATSEVAYYMNALSSNYPKAKSMDDIKAAATYTQAADGTALVNNGKFFVRYSSTYYPVKYGYVRVSGSYWSQYCWYYTRSNTNYSITTTTNPKVSGGKVGDFVIYQQTGGYAATEHSGYYATTESAEQVKDYFEDVLQDITTKITTEIILHEDTILRDVMGQGLVLTPGSVITAYKEKGTIENGEIKWSGELEYVASATIPANAPDRVNSPETTTVDYILDDGTPVVRENVPFIQIYNLNSPNATNPNAAGYQPHAVDVTGYDFESWYISEEKEDPTGYKMVVTITRIEARDDVQWSRSTATNHERSGLWLPADEKGNRELLLPFDQPTTIFVERAYVLDYGKEFTLSGWYFDDENGKDATPIHVDCDITDGMNWFDPANPNTANAIGGQYGNLNYGNVKVENGEVTYAPTSMNWGGYDQFYIFGNTWRKTVLAQDANENGNLWNKVTVIPANNIYYEDSFITTDSETQNGIEGFTFTGAWTVVGQDSGNTEVPEKNESAPYGDVHGWTDSLGDDKHYTDGSAHATGLNGEMAAKAAFTFTGTGVEVYTRTNAKSGMVVAVLNRITKNEDGTQSSTLYQSTAIDNLAMSGDYYHIPTIAFKKLPYGTYSLQLIATAASTGTGTMRYEYYIDGVRIHNPLGNTTNYQSDIVKDAYDLETNAVFTEIRDVLLDYGDFNAGLPDSYDSKLGAVFIDWIQDGQQSGNDPAGTGVPSYELGSFEAYGPKNEVYLSAGQAIVLRVAEGNHYYVGLKSLTGQEVTANLSGLDGADPTAITLRHSTDMYYQVTPIDGYIVIQNGNDDGAILSITNLRTTNLTGPVSNGGILPVTAREAVMTMRSFASRTLRKPDLTEPELQPDAPTVIWPSAEEVAQNNLQLASKLFSAVRKWLENQ